MTQKISLIIPNYNGQKLLARNLPKLIKAAIKAKEKYEIIVVDDASSDKSAEFLKEYYPQVKLIIHKTNRRFALSCNDGVRLAQGEIVILLNNDVTPEENFLKPLLDNFKDERVFAVGCKEESTVKGKSIFSGRALAQFKKGFLIHRRAENQEQKNTLWVASGSAAYRKKIWEELGGLDPIYSPAYMEDLDISYRALKAGYKVLFEPKSLVFHKHETTNIKVFGQTAIKTAALKNQLIFIWKNITDLNLLVHHLIWLPYHLIRDSLLTRGLFFSAFIQALVQLPKVLNSRNKVKKFFKIKDAEVLQNYA